MTGAAKRIGLEVLGWTLLVLGIAAVFLPGPGLLGIFAGLALLSQQYDWAERRVEPVRSVRSTDIDLLPMFGKPLLVYSGVASQVRPNSNSNRNLIALATRGSRVERALANTLP